MDRNSYNQNAHYHNRNSSMNCSRNNYGRTITNRNTMTNASETRTSCDCMDNMHMDRYDEGCDRGNEPVDTMMIAMSYVPWQKWKDIYSMEEALDKGTIFAQLDKPYIGRMSK